MPIPWLIGAAVVAVGAAVVKAVNDSDSDNDREEEERRARRQAEREAERENERQRQALEAAEQERQEQERLANLKQRAQHELDTLVRKYSLDGVHIGKLAQLSLDDTEQAFAVLQERLPSSKPYLHLELLLKAAADKQQKTDNLLKMVESV
jgi:uncharacterized membrane protein YqiK